MNDCCYTLVIKQLTCQNNVSKRTDNVSSNISTKVEIPLNFGYTLTYLCCTSTNVTISLSNTIFIPTTDFHISSNSYKIFDLPCECGTYRLYIGAVPASCNSCCMAN